MTGNGWDRRAFRRECAIPPEQLARLNALPGWGGFMQVRDASEKSPRRLSPDRPAAAHTPPERGVPRFESLASALTPEPHLTLPLAPSRVHRLHPSTRPRTRRLCTPTGRAALRAPRRLPGAFLRRQVAPNLILDEDDESSRTTTRAPPSPCATLRRATSAASPPPLLPRRLTRRWRVTPRGPRPPTRRDPRVDATQLARRESRPRSRSPHRAHAVAAPDRAHAVAAADGRGSGGGG